MPGNILHPTRCEQSPRRNTAPQIHMRVGPRSSQCCRKGPQVAISRTRAPAPHPLGRRPQAASTVHCTQRRRGLEKPDPSIKRTSSSNPERPLRRCATGQHHPALRFFYTPTLNTLGPLPLATCQRRTSSLQYRLPATAMDTHNRSHPG